MPDRGQRRKESRPDSASRLSGTVQLVATLISPLTVISALLFYFGWARSAVQARELGIDESVLDMSTRDYLLRSVSSLWLPLAASAAIGLAWLWVHGRIVMLSARGGRSGLVTVTARALSLSWLAAVAVALVLGRFFPLSGEIAAPLVLGLGVLITAYGVSLGRLTTASRTAGLERTSIPGALQTALAGALLALLLFWAVENYASIVGRGLADRIAANVNGLVAVTVYSPTKLHLDSAPGVKETTLPGDPTAYRFRYTGLRLLQKSGGKYFLLPEGWTRDQGSVVVLQENPALRLEFANHP